MEESLDYISPILPADFFRFSFDLHQMDLKDAFKKKHVLPTFSELTFENEFAKVACGWNFNGLFFEVEISHSFEEAFFPQYRKGDSIELFLDTRDLKTTGFPTKFCHHFVILPVPVEGIIAQEVTRFRSDDRHEHCDPETIRVKGELGKKKALFNIFLPSESLYGYDPSGFDRLGLSYRINRKGGDPQHLTLSSDYWNIEKEPSLWCSTHLRKG